MRKLDFSKLVWSGKTISSEEALKNIIPFVTDITHQTALNITSDVKEIISDNWKGDKQ